MQLLDQEHFQIICNAGVREEIPKGYVFYDGYEAFDAVYCLVDGLCALMSLKDSGKEHVYHYMKSGSLIGFIPAFLEYIHEENADSEAYFLLKAKSPCTVYRIEKGRIFELMQTYPLIMKWMMGSMADNSRNMIRHFYNAQESNAVAKIAITLLSLGEETDEGFILQKEFNYPEISRYLGVHHITVARIIGGFKAEGLIVKTGHMIKILDSEAIMEYAQNKRVFQY